MPSSRRPRATRSRRGVRRAGLAAALAAAPVALAYRFAVIYRSRAGHPRPRPPIITPADLGLPFEELTVHAPGAELAAWFIPARDGAAGPGVLLVHGWESARDRTLPIAAFLHEVGFHILTIDVRGHGANEPEVLPVSAGEFGLDALAGFQALLARPEVTLAAIAGHSLGATGVLLAAAADDRVAAVVATSAAADPLRLTRQTFRLARLPIPDPVAYPLAWLTTRVFVRPRGHVVRAISASAALARYRGPVLLVHGDADEVIPIEHFQRLARAALHRDRIAAWTAETLAIAGGQHSWLYEFPEYRRAVARFLARTLGGPLSPDEAARIAGAMHVTRPPEPDSPFSAVDAEPGGLRSLAAVVRPGRAGPPPASVES
ncbi:MAG TPA: alpha/beta hydrolase [Candidatus Limnocylindrales bacterium]